MALERTLGLIKPDAVANRHVGHVLTAIEGTGIHVVAAKFIKLTREQAEAFYGVHRGKPFFDELVEYIMSGPLVAMVLEGEDAVHRWRELLGSTDPAKAAPDTIRGRFGQDLTRNACHGSDSLEHAEEELTFFFSHMDLVHYPNA